MRTNKAREVLCVSCHVPMDFIGSDTLQRYNRGSKIKKLHYYKCIVCDYQETVIGSGYYSIDCEPEFAAKEAARKGGFLVKGNIDIIDEEDE